MNKFKQLRKEKKILLAVGTLVVSVAIIGGIVAITRQSVFNAAVESSSNSLPTNNESTGSDMTKSEARVSSSNNSDVSTQDTNTTITSDTSPQSSIQNGDSTIRSAPSQPTTQSSTPVAQPSTPTPQQVAVTCNEALRSSYTANRDVMIAAENAQWANQIAGFNQTAQDRGLLFSGYTQNMINQHKPAHDARLTSISTQHQSNLASINC